MFRGLNSPDSDKLDEKYFEYVIIVIFDDDLKFDEPLPIVLKTDSFSSVAAIDDTDKLKDLPTDQKFPYCQHQEAP